MYRTFSVSLIVVTIVMVVLAGMEFGRIKSLESNVAGLESSINKLASTTNQLAAQFTNQIANQKPVTQTIVREIQAPATGGAVSNPKPQDLTAMVGRVTPAVVSIVISKAVPQLEVAYVDPFGGNSAFGDSGIRIPVYRQKGTTVQKVGAGSGFIVSQNGYIVTNKHVVADTQASYTVLLANGIQETAQVIYRDPNNDMAIVKIPGLYGSYLSLGDSSKLALGQSVVAIGNALGEYNNSVSTGIISGLNRSIQAYDQVTGEAETLTGVIQTDAAINSGNSGGPLLDLNGNVVGINVATVSGSNNIGFAIPINSVKATINNVI